MRDLRMKIAALAVTLGIGGIVGFAISAGRVPREAVAVSPQGTKVIRRTVHAHPRRRHVTGERHNGNRAALAAAAAPVAPVSTGSSGSGSYGSGSQGSAPIHTGSSGSASGSGSGAGEGGGEREGGDEGGD